MDLVVQGGQVLTPDGLRALNIGVRDGRIAALTPDRLPQAAEVIDARGRLVLPGVVDVHVHYYSGGFARTSKVAVESGITTAIYFVRGESAQELPDHVIGSFLSHAAEEAHGDFACHCVLLESYDALSRIPAVVAQGVPTFKMFLTYRERGMACSDRFLIEAMYRVKEAGGAVLLHAENGEFIDALHDRFQAASVRAEETYLASQPPWAEASGIHTALSAAALTGCPLYIVHLTTALGLEQIRLARTHGVTVLTETCPQYLTLTSDELQRQGALVKIGPPLRSPRDQEALWEALETGDIRIISSDHAAYPRSTKDASADFSRAPFGMPGLRTLLPLVYTEGVVRRGLPLEWLGKVLAEIPARRFGLYPRKGVIAEGSDADLLIVDPDWAQTVDPSTQDHGTDYSPYTGQSLQGWPEITILRGRIVARNGTYVADAPAGQFLPRSRVNWQDVR